MATDFDRIRVDDHPDDERVRRVRLDDPDRYNVIDEQSLAELTVAFEAADRDDAVDAILFGTTSDHFCSGADLAELLELDIEAGIRWLTGFHETIECLRETGKPVIGAVEGSCVAGGNELVAGCDLVVAGESARFGQPEVGVGSTAAGGGVQLLPLVVGEKRARELLLTGRLLSAAEAVEWGLINRVVDDGTADTEARELASTIVDEKSPQAYRVIKAMLRPWQNLGMTQWELARELTATTWTSPEFRERAEAFLDGDDMPSDGFSGVRRDR